MDDHLYFEEADRPGLYLVRSPENGVPYTCDIFIVHGLNGGPAKTFKHPETGNIWFRDMLPEHVIDHGRRINARIWTYGYNATFAFQNAGKAGAFDFALELLESVNNVRKPNHKIMWVCHSLGGIVVKTALVEAAYRQQYKAILQSTVGVIFVGTPHRGSSFADLGDVAQRIGEAMFAGIYRPNRDLLKSLKKDCNSLFETASRFTEVCTGMKIFSFYETEGTTIVERKAALTYVQGETYGPMNASHRDLCKYRDKTDPNYIKIRNSIRQLLDRTVAPAAPRAAQQTSSPVPRSTEGNYPPNVSAPRAPSGQYTPGISQAYHQQQYVPGHGYPGFAYPPPRPPKEPVFAGTPPFQSNNPYYQAQYNRPALSPYSQSNASSQSSSPYPDQDGYQPYRKPVPSPAPTGSSSHPRSPSEASTSSLHLSVPSDNDSTSVNTDRRRPTPYQMSSSSFAKESFPERRGSSATTTPSSEASTPASSISDTSMLPDEKPGASRSTTPVPSNPKPTPVPAQQKPVPPNPAPTPNPQLPTDKKPAAAEIPPTEPSTWTCDGCMGPILVSQPRIHCKECEDYDLCPACFRNNRTSKDHQTDHQIRRILTTHVLTAEDLMPPTDNVNPEYVPGKGKLRNWSVDGNLRWLHLRTDNGHARYFAYPIEPGQYHVEIIAEATVSNKLLEEHKTQIEEEGGLGKLRVAVGFPKNRKDFNNATYTENDKLAANLFNGKSEKNWVLHPTGGLMRLPMSAVFHVKPNDPTTQQMGFMLQWSDVRQFEGSDDSLLSITLLEVRLEHLLEYKPAAKPQQPAASSSSAASAAAQEKASAEAKIAEIFSEAILAAAEENIRVQKQRQAEAQEAAVAREYVRQYYEAQKRAEEEALLRQILLQRQKEKEQREADEALAALFLYGAMLNGGK